ncbi:TetR family transcriptional regulator [Actibacterium mucosum]
MKALAASAGVSQSLLHYHFGSKDRLYAAVIEHRSSLINQERQKLLQAIEPTAADRLAQVFRALFLPALGPSGGGRAYARIFAGLIVGNARDEILVRKNYDDTARLFVAAIHDCFPNSTVTQAAQIYLAALGVLTAALPRDGRAGRLAGGEHLENNQDEFVESLIRFAVGGAVAIQNG